MRVALQSQQTDLEGLTKELMEHGAKLAVALREAGEARDQAQHTLRLRDEFIFVFCLRVEVVYTAV